ncbi:recombinase family protein [Desulfosporosinus sp. Sb-LF]|uniref:recombinase family protein n=1 Tax=Desulfosporosinus sp. Sb-LF TaxID=2560027 RepID=UPI00107F9E51|nr:recombinase family protein [Desulfosporosinus sp. Sb-LF]TGE32862.1 hypothetical protein E4K68_08415 [Desulfosporosinus sp. Sb-LF]
MDICLYLRKSRADSKEQSVEDVLARHERSLRELAERNGYRIVDVFREVCSGESIQSREQMKAMLTNVQAKMYDGVLVTEQSRLTRGNMKDGGIVQETFKDSNTKIITLTKTIDFNESNMYDFEHIINARELENTKRRLNDGVNRSAKLGYWVSGVPPIGYLYNSSTKGLEIVESEAVIVREIFARVLAGQNYHEIVAWLNIGGIATRKDGNWHVNQIKRILPNETYIGYAVHGRTRWEKFTDSNGEEKRREIALPREQWTVVPDSFPAIIDKETFDKVATLLAARKQLPKRSREGRHPLSGVVSCAKCGHLHQIQKNSNGNLLKACNYRSPEGVRCENKGVSLSEVYKAIRAELGKLQETLVNAPKATKSSGQRKSLERQLQRKQSELTKLTGAVQRINDLYELGDIARLEYLERKAKRQGEIVSKQREISEIQNSIRNTSGLTNEQRLEYIEEFCRQWTEEVNDNELNRAFHKLFAKVEYLREGEEVTLTIELN